MDVIIRLGEVEYQDLLGDLRDFTKMWGWHYHIVKRLPNKKKVKRYNRVYFIHDDRLVGYGVINDVLPVDQEFNTEFQGVMYRDIGKAAVIWKAQNWYIEPYYCFKIRKAQAWKYFNLKKWLKGRPESDIVDLAPLREAERKAGLKAEGRSYTDIMRHCHGKKHAEDI